MADDRDDVAIAGSPPPSSQPVAAGAAPGLNDNGPGSVNARPPRRGTRLVWWQRKIARTMLRSLFCVMNVVVFFISLLVLVEFVREIEREQKATGEGTSPVPADGPTPPPTPSPDDLTWKDRYVLLGQDVFGSDYKTVVDVYFAFIIVATFSGAFGALLRQTSPIFLAVVCYVPAWFMTLVATIGIHRHMAASSHDASKARYSVALAWSWLCLFVLIALFVVGVFLGRSMRVHKADRYRITHRGRLRRGDDDDYEGMEDDDDADDDAIAPGEYAETMVSNVPNFTTDGSGPPRKRQVAKIEQHRQHEAEKGAAASPTTTTTDSKPSPPGPSPVSVGDATKTNFARQASRKAAAPLTADDVRRLLLQSTVDELPQGQQVERQQCHHVYDGDTLTLQNRERVRLVGIDTPEISRFEPFAEEARAFTKRWCQQRTLFLVTPSASMEAAAAGRTNASSGNDKFMVDKYGRRRAVVYVAIRKDQLLPNASDHRGSIGQALDDAANATAYLNVNEALLLFGFATFYHSSPANEAPFQARFIALQREAREASRGVWGGFQDREVCYDKKADVFHNFVPKGASVPSNASSSGICDTGRGLCGKAGQSAGVAKQLASKALDAGYAPCRECQGTARRAY